jgi:intracellular sulfur oxidation DsrE/DsrF family protein
MILKLRHLAGLVGMALVWSSASLLASDETTYAPQKVAYHVNYYGAKKQAGALRNVQNHINALGADNVEVQVVMHGNGLSLLLPPDEVEGTKMQEGNASDEMQARISGLKDQGVEFKICANTLQGRQVELAALYDADQSDVVPSGVAELSKLQGEGFTYLKP